MVCSVFCIMFSCIGFAAAQTDKAPALTYSTDGPVNSIAISADDNHFVIGTKSVDGGTVYFFDNQGKLLWKSIQDRHILSVAISDDGSHVAAAGSKYSGTGAGRYYAGLVYFFDKDGNLLWKYDTNDTAVIQVSMTFDGSHVAVDTSGGILYLDKYGKLLWSHNDASTNDHPVKITRDGSMIATKDSQKLRVFDKNGTLLWEDTEGDSGGAFTFSDDGKFLATSADPSGMDLLDRNGKQIWKDEVGMHFISTSFSKDGSYIVSSAQQWGADNSGGLFLFDNNARVLWQRPGDGYSAISSDGSYIVMGLWANVGPSVLFYDTQGNLLWQHASGLVHSIAISHDGKYAIAGIGDSNYGDGSVQLFTNEQATESPLNQISYAENKTSPVIITQVELGSAFAFFPDNQTCYDKPGFSNNYTCSTDLVPGHKVQCAYFIGSSYCEPIRQYTSGTNQSCFNNYPASSAPQWFDVYNTMNTTIHLQNFTIIEKWNQGPYGNIGPYSTVMEMKPNEKCTIPIAPVDEPLAMYLNNMSMEITYHYNGKDYNITTPSLSDTNNDTRTWQLDGNKWVFAEQNTITIPEFPFAIPILLISITSVIAFYDMKFRK